jgi:hypothetical protein
VSGGFLRSASGGDAEAAALASALDRMLDAGSALHRQMAADVLLHWILPAAEGEGEAELAAVATGKPPEATMQKLNALLACAQSPPYAELATKCAPLPGVHGSAVHIHATPSC